MLGTSQDGYLNKGNKLFSLMNAGLIFIYEEVKHAPGTRANIMLPTVKGRNVTLIAAINSGGVVHHTIISNSTLNAEKFKFFIKGLLEKIRPELNDSYLVMDNAQIHKRNDIKSLIESNRCSLKFLPPYSQMLNPIENAFSKIKGYARAELRDLSTEHNIVDVIERSIQQLTQQDCSNYVMDMVLKIPQAANREPLH